jgi:hypothetical protein
MAVGKRETGSVFIASLLYAYKLGEGLAVHQSEYQVNCGNHSDGMNLIHIVYATIKRKFSLVNRKK